MKPKEFADLLDISTNTVRRWCAEYQKYLTSTAYPTKGETRVLAPHDVRVLHFVAEARNTGLTNGKIIARLDAMLATDWRDLPDTPPEWDRHDEMISLPAAVSHANDVAQIAVLQRDLEYTRQALQTASERIESLQAELDAAYADKAASKGKIHALEIELITARGQVDAAHARLSTYTLTGDQPVPLVILVGATALAVAALVIVLLVVARLVVG